MRKGQATIEFIFIILIVTIYIFGVTKPILENTQGIIEDIENISKANYAAQQIINTSNKISFLGNGSKETITIFVPRNARLECDENKIVLEVEINKTGNNPNVGLCEDNNCIKEYSIRDGIDLNCEGQVFLFGIRNVSIEKVLNKIKIKRVG
jgi:hypothetical protein